MVCIGDVKEVVTCGLFSGSRLTTLINTVCNHTYIDATMRLCERHDPRFQRPTRHFKLGDDGLMDFQSAADYELFLAKAE